MICAGSRCFITEDIQRIKQVRESGRVSAKVRRKSPRILLSWDPPGTPTDDPKMRLTWLWSAFALVIIAGGSYGLYFYLRPEQLSEQLLYGNGHIEGTEVRVSAEVKGRVVESSLIEGTAVAKGDRLIRIDDTDLMLERARAKADIAAIERERKQAEVDLDTWRHHRHTAESDLARYRRLQERGTVSPQRLEEAEDAFQEANGRVAVLEAQIGEFDARLEVARKTLGLIEYQIEKTRVSSPIDGTVLVKAVEPGEFVQPGKVLAVLVNLSRMELKVFIPEKDIGKVKLGDPARVRVDAFPDRQFEAAIARVDQEAQFTPRDIHMPEERVRMVFGVTLALDNPEAFLKPGMPADAWILWKPNAGWPQRLPVPQ